jgi:hypothetical protein
MYFDKTEIYVDGVGFDIKHNVKSITTDVNTSLNTYETYTEQISICPKIFFIFETPYHSAFGHWVFESAIFLPYVKNFPSARLLVNANPKRDYKHLFFNLFDIHADMVQYMDNVGNEENIYQNIPKDNICIIIRNFTWNNKTEKSRDATSLKLYNELLIKFRQIIDIHTPKYTEHLFLPRNTTQNYVYNDKVIDYTKIMNLLSGKEYISYNTMETTDFKKQIALVSSAKNIYLDFGSNYQVNGFFSKQSTIYCINKMEFQLSFPFLAAIVHIIEKENTVIYI